MEYTHIDFEIYCSNMKYAKPNICKYTNFYINFFQHYKNRLTSSISGNQLFEIILRRFSNQILFRTDITRYVINIHSTLLIELLQPLLAD